MKYKSTRGGVTGLSFEEALYTGYAEDGGILLPESIPSIATETLKSWAELSYKDIAKKVVPLFVSENEIPSSDLNEMLDRAFSRFTDPAVAPIKKLPTGLNVMELYHGPTWSFKDLALSCVGQFLEYFLAKGRKHLTILVGTSGDTGSSAIEAVRGSKWVDIIVMLPRGRCSKTQELQMTTVIEDNVHVYRVDGTSDDLDLPIKKCFTDTEFCRKHNLCSINSINWARIMVQTVHYIYAYLQMCPNCDSEVQIVIPTGACGNVTSGFVARLMGVPLKFVCAVTQNDIVARTVRDGDYSVTKDVIPTLAPAMDIQIPYNMERIWFLLTKGDHKLIQRLMAEFENNGKVRVPENLARQVREIITDTFIANDDVVKETMMKTWKDFSYLICPHTAIGVAYHYQQIVSDNDQKDKTNSRVIISTATWAKFEDALTASGIQQQQTSAVKDLYEKKQKYQDMEKGEDWLNILRNKIVNIDEKCKTHR